MFCTIFGPIIAMAINAAKRIPLLGVIFARFPKVVAAVLAAVIALVQALAGDHGTIETVLRCVAENFAGAVATHEVIKTAVQVAAPKPAIAPAPAGPPRSPMGGA